MSEAQRRLARALQLNRRFQVAFVFGTAVDGRALVANAVADAAKHARRPYTLHWFLPDNAASEPEDGIPQAASVWVVDLEETPDEVGPQLVRLNRTRDSMGRHPYTTLVVLLRGADGNAPARYAPDLWSVRSFATALHPDDDTSGQILTEWTSGCGAALESLLEQRPQHRPAYQHGTYRFGYRVRGAQPMGSSRDLLTLMSGVPGYTGWRPWWVPTNVNAPYAVGGGAVECWMVHDDRTVPDPAHSDFWRASTDGCFYLVRGFDEDGEPEPGSKLSMSLPIWRLAEALLHAQHVAQAMAVGVPQVEFWVAWSGLRGRTPSEWPKPFALDLGLPRIEANTIETTAMLDVEVLSKEDGLNAAVCRLLRPLYDVFLETPEPRDVQRELDELRSRPPRG